MIPDWILAFIRVILGGFFACTGIIKLFDLKGFSVIVAKYGLLPRQLVKPMAYAQPFIEASIGFWLLSNRQLRLAALAALALMIAATVFVVYALAKNKRIDNCGCYGAWVKIPVTWKKVVENLAWIAAAAILAWSTF